jgi:hypothetical protein
MGTLKKYVEDLLQIRRFPAKDEIRSESYRFVTTGSDGNGEMTPEELQRFLRDLDQAHEEWMQAQKLFDQAVEHELIDYMISILDSAEKKYNMLLKQARKLGIRFHLQ